jgi:predicted metallopeptidase
MRIKFDNRTTNLELNSLIYKASALLEMDSVMMADIRCKNDFKYESGSGLEVSLKIYKCDKVAPIFFYKPKWRFTKAMGYSDGKAIHLNSYKFDSFSDADIIGLLLHEYLHFVGFNHGTGMRANYWNEDKSNHSAPYFVSDNISRWL